GTMLTFNLYSDAACTTMTHTQTISIDNVDLVEKLKRFSPSGAATKPPKTDELHATLTGVLPAATTYLKATGTGITAVGGACQAQASAQGTAAQIIAFAHVEDTTPSVLSFGGNGTTSAAAASCGTGCATVTFTGSYTGITNDKLTVLTSC